MSTAAFNGHQPECICTYCENLRANYDGISKVELPEFVTPGQILTDIKLFDGTILSGKFRVSDDGMHASPMYAIAVSTLDISRVPGIPEGSSADGMFSDAGSYTSALRGMESALGLSEGALSPHTTPSASDFLQKADKIMRQRGEQYDKEGGERSMAQTVKAFNAITGRDLTETEGWTFMLILKQTRLFQNRKSAHQDSCEDSVAYASLQAESAMKNGV